MNWFGPSFAITTNDMGAELRFLVERRVTLLDLSVAAIAFCGVFFALVHRQFWWSIVCLVALASPIKALFKISDVYLEVSERGIRRGSAFYAWTDIRGLEYQSGGEDGPSGLFARTGNWSGPCLIRDLNESQSNEIIKHIYERFSTVTMADDTGSPSLFGKWSEPIALNLSKKD